LSSHWVCCDLHSIPTKRKADQVDDDDGDMNSEDDENAGPIGFKMFGNSSTSVTTTTTAPAATSTASKFSSTPQAADEDDNDDGGFNPIRPIAHQHKPASSSSAQQVSKVSNSVPTSTSVASKSATTLKPIKAHQPKRRRRASSEEDSDDPDDDGSDLADFIVDDDGTFTPSIHVPSPACPVSA
jgi:hypothetical protein